MDGRDWGLLLTGAAMLAGLAASWGQSSEKSATNRFNRLFSSSSCRRRRNSLTPRCAYFFFHA